MGTDEHTIDAAIGTRPSDAGRRGDARLVDGVDATALCTRIFGG
ncbi:MAG TPA: hypothetical protein VL049_09745 [Candidatus Dormibacteraeota bacterium]|nr:hypothetical protein [Candidatus Dormibacteraeota bacterium]